MRNTRRLVGLASLAVMLGAVYFVAYGAIIGCPAAAVCVGTNATDIITAGGAAQTIFGLAGNDTITDGTAFAKTIFGGSGNDQISVTAGAGVRTIFGEDGNDIISIALGAAHALDGGRGHDTFIITAAADGLSIIDGLGRDGINVATGVAFDITVTLVNDNEPDNVVLSDAAGAAHTVILTLGSGRDFIDCGSAAGGDVAADFDIVFLNGNNKAVGSLGGTIVNLRQLALLGGSTDTCETIIP